MKRRIAAATLVAVLTCGAGTGSAAQQAPAQQAAAQRAAAQQAPEQRRGHGPGDGSGGRSVDGTEYPPELLEQLEEVRAATERFRDHDTAVAEGYELVAGDGPLMGEHWVRRDLVDRPFDIASPSTLQYLEVDGRRVLTGVAYTVYRGPDDPLPEGFVGDHDAWHVHDLMKISMAATDGRPVLRWITERRIANGRTRWSEDRAELTMVHAWVWLDNPDGVFAQDHRLIPYMRAGLSLAWGTDASLDAAHGVALLEPDACALEVRRTSFMAGASWRQRRTLAGGCDEAAGAVRAALDGADVSDPSAQGGEALNGAAESAWRGYVARRSEVLTEQQLARLAVGIEHPGEHGGHDTAHRRSRS